MTVDHSFPCVQLKVADVEPLGPHTLAIGKVAEAPFTAQVHAASKIGPDGVAEVPINPDKMHFFLTSTGESIDRQ
jgi:multiple sugar transport system ATP-binding protein